jgi:hypothetical protein
VAAVRLEPGVVDLVDGVVPGEPGREGADVIAVALVEDRRVEEVRHRRVVGVDCLGLVLGRLTIRCSSGRDAA